MTAKRIPLYDLKVAAATRREVDQVLSSGWLTTGAKVKELEKQVARLAGNRYAVAVASATQGLHLVFESLGLGSGSEVITTPFTFIATIEAILQSGATPVFADIDPYTLTIDPDEVRRKLTGRTKCIVPVDIAGYPCEYDELNEIANKRSIPLVSDAAHSLGAKLSRRKVGRWVDAAVHSFQATKNLTCGEGGIVVTPHKMLAERVRLLSLHAMTKNAYQRRTEGKWEYDIVGLGFKANMSDIHAAVGLGQLSAFEANQKKRRELAKRYAEKLAPYSDYIRIPKPSTGHQSAWHLYIIQLRLSRLSITRSRFIKLMSDRNIECGVHYKPVFHLSFYKQLGMEETHYPNATYAARRVVTLPLFAHLKLSEVDRVCRAIGEIVTEHAR